MAGDGGQRRLAQALGVGESEVSMWLHGQRSIPRAYKGHVALQGIEAQCAVERERVMWGEVRRCLRVLTPYVWLSTGELCRVLSQAEVRQAVQSACNRLRTCLRNIDRGRDDEDGAGEGGRDSSFGSLQALNGAFAGADAEAPYCADAL